MVLKDILLKKSGTPTMGGVLILSSILISVFIWSDLKNIFIWITLLSTLCFGLIGIIDDYIKIKSLRTDGLNVSTRIFSSNFIRFVNSLFNLFFFT